MAPFLPSRFSYIIPLNFLGGYVKDMECRAKVRGKIDLQH